MLSHPKHGISSEIRCHRLPLACSSGPLVYTAEIIRISNERCTEKEQQRVVTSPPIVIQRKRAAQPLKESMQTRIAPAKRSPARQHLPTKDFATYIKLVSRDTGLNIDCPSASVIDVLTRYINDSASPVSFLDFTSLFGYLATALTINCPSSSFYSIVNTSKEPDLRRTTGFIQQSRRLRLISLGVPSTQDDWSSVVMPMPQTCVKPSQVIDYFASKNANPITHLYAHLQQSLDDIIIEYYLRYFSEMPELQEVLFLSKPCTMITILSRYDVERREVGRITGDFGGQFSLYIITRQAYERRHPPLAISVEDD